MSVTNEDSNDSQQRKAPDARQSEVSFYKLYSKEPEINDIDIGCTKRLLRHMTKHYYVSSHFNYTSTQCICIQIHQGARRLE